MVNGTLNGTLNGTQRLVTQGWRRLACAILIQAVKDAREGNGHSQDARRFLAGPGARRLAVLLDLDAGGLAHALANLPDLQQPGYGG